MPIAVIVTEVKNFSAQTSLFLHLYQLLQLKSKLSGGIKCDAVNKIYLGQLLAYIIGIVLMDIQKVVDLTQPWLRIYMEESKVRTLH